MSAFSFNERVGRSLAVRMAVWALASSAVRAEAPPVEVPRWQMHEFALHGAARVENPFRDATLVGTFTAPSGKTHVIEGFHDGGDTWRLRFAPNEEGEWRYWLRGEGAELSQHRLVRCVAPRGHGFIRVQPQHPYAFAYDDGTSFFPMGDTCYGLYDDNPITPALRSEYLEARRRQRFNFIRMSVGHSDAWNRIDPANHYAFTVKDEGAAAQLAALYDFFAALPFWRMEPFAGVTREAVALAEPGRLYVVYLPRGGATTVDLRAASDTIAGRWFDPRRGQLGDPFDVAGGGHVTFESPDANDWVLRLRVTAQGARPGS